MVADIKLAYNATAERTHARFNMEYTADVTENWEALTKYVEYFWGKREQQQLYRFEADVSFRSDRDVDQRTHVYIDFHDGAVSPVRFAEKGELNPVFVHTEFRPTNTAMKFEDGELHIIGRSPKVGRYVVRISAI